MYDNFAIKTCGLSKSFNGKEVVRGCNMTVERNTIYGLIGRNGAGKTTIFKLLLGLLEPTYGTATVLGLESHQDKLKILKRTGSVIETPIFYEHLSAIENLKIHLEYMQMGNADIEGVLELVGLENAGSGQVATFSLGMRQRLAIARALVHQPDLLILDEPINGMDPIGIREMRDLFRKLVKKDITIVFSSHILSEVEQIADCIAVISNGRILSEKSLREIEKEYPDGIEDYFMKMAK